MKNNFKLGQLIWFECPLSEKIKCGYIEEINNDSIKIHGILKRDDSFIGSMYMTPEQCFSTEEEAKDSYYLKHKNIVDSYKNNIITLNDLINFPLKHCLVGKDVDFDALQAYIEYASECGFKINNNFFRKE